MTGGLNRVPCQNFPPPPARGRTRTSRRNYSVALLARCGPPGCTSCLERFNILLSSSQEKCANFAKKTRGSGHPTDIMALQKGWTIRGNGALTFGIDEIT